MVLNKTLQEIHQGYKNKKNKIFVLNRKSVCSLLDLLIAEGFILKYSKGENNKLSIWLKYEKSTPAIKGVKFYSTCKKQVFINLKK